MTEINEVILQRALCIGTSTWSDALDTLNIHGVTQGIKRRAGQGRIVGRAVTARQTCGKLGDFDRADFAVGRLVDATGPNTVLVVDVDGQAISTFGGIASKAASLKNATAILIDGGCRDVDEIQETGVWLASRHVTPITGKSRLCLEEMGGQVSLGGVTVNQGDLVVGDDTGIVVIPSDRIEQVLDAAEALLATDDKVAQAVDRGVSFGEAAAAANYIPKKA